MLDFKKVSSSQIPKAPYDPATPFQLFEAKSLLTASRQINNAGAINWRFNCRLNIERMGIVLHHVELYVSNLDRSRVFWSWLLGRLGYVHYQEWAHGFSFKFADSYIVFVQVDERYQADAYHRKHVGLNHLAFHAPSRQAVDLLAIELSQRGVPILYGSPSEDGESYKVFFEDPDRIKVEYVTG